MPSLFPPQHLHSTALVDRMNSLSINGGGSPVSPSSLSPYSDPILRPGTSMDARSHWQAPPLYSQGAVDDTGVDYGGGGQHGLGYGGVSYSPQFATQDEGQLFGHPAGDPRMHWYNNQYMHAASNVLGMGPPPPPPPPPVPYPYQSTQSTQSLPLLDPRFPPQGGQVMNPMVPQDLGVDDTEFELRRSSTSLGSDKMKAVDVNAPPFTKEYIDEYRQRIKGDPDPEAQFKYAKYLIEAAKKIIVDGKSPRAPRKYRDALITEALKVMRRLASQNDPYDEALFFMANCHGTGMLGLNVDHERAYILYLQAAKQNHASAAYRAAVCSELGAGTKKDTSRAVVFYKKAASLGDTAAMYKLGVILLNGHLGEKQSPRDGFNWLKRAAEQADAENPHALHELAGLYEAPKFSFIIPDAAYAKELHTSAAHLGFTLSQFKLGQCYQYGTLDCPVDPRRSIAWYTKAAEKGHPEAELALSGWYLTGSEGILRQSDSEAYLWARKAANRGLSNAEYAVGYFAEVGIGIKQDMEFAKRWYMRAAGGYVVVPSSSSVTHTACIAQGNARAISRLTEMKRTGSKRPNAGRPTRQEAKDECVIC